MADRMPLEDTGVPVARTVSAIIELLKSAGFTDIIQRTKDGEFSLAASHSDVSIVVDPNVSAVRDILARRKPGWRYSSEWIHAQAERIAWRIQYEYVKAAVDSIKWRAQTMGQALGGRVLLQDREGHTMQVADFLTMGLDNGHLNPGNLLRLTAPKGEK